MLNYFIYVLWVRTDTVFIQFRSQWESPCPFDLKKKKMTLFDFGLGSSIVLLEPKQIRVSFHTAVPVQQPSWADFKWSAEQRLMLPPRLLPAAAQVEERRPSPILSTSSRGTRWCVYYISWTVIYNGDDSPPLTIQPSIDVCTSQKWHGWNKEEEEDNIG